LESATLRVVKKEIVRRNVGGGCTVERRECGTKCEKEPRRLSRDKGNCGGHQACGQRRGKGHHFGAKRGRLDGSNKRGSGLGGK